MKIVLDTNIFISAFLWGGKPQQILKLAENGRVKIVISESIRSELERKLTTKKQLVERLELIEKSVSNFLELLVSLTQVVEITNFTVVVVRDTKDDMILATAVAGKVDCIVTGDKDLLVLQEFNDIKIVNTNTFLELFEDNLAE